MRGNVRGAVQVFPIRDKAENQAITALHAEIKQRVLAMGAPGLYTVRLAIADTALQLATIEPMSIATMALISKASGSSVTRLLLHVKLGEALTKVMYDYPDVNRLKPVYVQANTFPYNHLQIYDEVEATGEPGHATGTVIAHGDTLKAALTALNQGNEDTDF